MNASILISAWSAAASDIYIGSRFLFFLARRGHAPAFLGHLFKLNARRSVADAESSDGDTTDVSEGESGNESDYNGTFCTTMSMQLELGSGRTCRITESQPRSYEHRGRAI